MGKNRSLQSQSEWVSEYILSKWAIFSAISWQEWDDDESCYTLNWTTPVDRQTVMLLNIILIPSYPVFVLTFKCCVLGGEASTTNSIFFGWPGWGKHTNHYTTEGVALVTEQIILFNLFLCYNDSLINVVISNFFFKNLRISTLFNTCTLLAI